MRQESLQTFEAEPSRLESRALRRHTLVIDIAVAAVLAIIAAGYAATVHASLNPRFFARPAGNDVWFEADMPTVAENVLQRWSDHYRNARHPLFPLVAIVPSYALRAIGLTESQRLLAFTIASAAAWSLVVFALLRSATRSRLDAIVFTLLALVTAGAVFWLPTVETYTLGSATLLVPLALAARDRSRRRESRFVAASAVSLSMTTSNWVSGIAVAFSGFPLKRAIQITANALVAVIALWGVQHLLVPGVPFFIGDTHGARFVFPELAGGPVPILRALLVHSIAMPAIDVIAEPKWGLRMSVQHSAFGSAGVLDVAASLVWIALLAIGIHAMWKIGRKSPLVLPLMLTTAGQCAVYLCYGEETFLYALHIAPLLVICAAHAVWIGRRWVTPLAAALAVLLAINNLTALRTATGFFDRVAHHAAVRNK